MQSYTALKPLTYRAIFGILILAVSFLSALAQQKRGDDADSIKLNTTLVQVPAVVTDRTGRFVSDLARDDFKVFEDGKRQEIALFTALKQPFNAVLILDTSNSAEDRLHAIQHTAVSFSRELGPGDRMMIVSFDNEVRQLTDFTQDQKELEQAIKGTESGFGKLLYEAVTLGLERLKDVEGRRAVILFSDGVDMKSIEASAETTMKKAEEIGAVIYVVRFDTRWWIEAEARRQKSENPESKIPFSVDGRIPLPPDFGGPDATPTGIPKPSTPKIEIGSRPSPPVTVIDSMSNERRTYQNRPADPITKNLDMLYGEADSFLKDLTTRTGGRVFPAENFEATRSSFAAIADEMRNQYVLGYYPANERSDGKYRKIKVEVVRKDIQVRARAGYRTQKPGEDSR